MGVVTNKPGMFTEALLDRMGMTDYFDVIVSGDTTAHRTADLARLLVGLPCGAAARLALAAASIDVTGVDVAGVDVGVAVDVDVGIPAVVSAVAAAGPGRTDRRTPDDTGGHCGATPGNATRSSSRPTA